MLIKTENQKMPFVPSFPSIFILEIFITIATIGFLGGIFIVFPIIAIILTVFLYKNFLKKFEALWREYLKIKRRKDSKENLEQQKNILKILDFAHKKMPYFPIKYDKEWGILEEKIKNFLANPENEKFAISHIANYLTINDDEKINSIYVNFTEMQKKINEIWLHEIRFVNLNIQIFSVINIFVGFLILEVTNGNFVMILIGLWWFLFSFFLTKDQKRILEKIFENKDGSLDYIKLLQISEFYHAKLDDFYNFVFHENNFLPETPLLFADIITLLSENFSERKKFLKKYRKVWTSWIRAFFIIPRKIPREVESIISEEEQKLENEIRNIQGKIREWAEFEKKKIMTISLQNKETFPNLELSNKRQETLIKNFENLTK